MKKPSLRMILASLLVASLALPACTVKDVNEETTDAIRIELTTEEQTQPEVTTEADTETPVPSVPPVDPATFGNAAITYECEDGSLLSTYMQKTAEDFAGVCSYYIQAGYNLYNTSDMGGNLSSTYVKGDAMAHIYYHPSNDEMNIVLSETAGATLPPATPAVTDGDYECTVVQMMDAEHVNGMGYIIQLKDGSYIVYDGAYSSQTNKIERYLTENHKGEGKPIIRAWVLTHSHNDHYPVFQMFAKRTQRGEKFIIEHVIVSPMNEDNYFMNDPNDRDPYLSTEFYEDVAKFTGAKVVFAHTGMKFTFCNLDMEILYAPESHYKTTDDLGNFNNTSVVTRLSGEGYSALFTGDVGMQGANIMLNLYGDYLKSDICQISHHGVEDVPLSFYEKVQAAILYYPCDLWLYDQTDRHWEERKAMETWDCTKEILIAGLGQYVRAWGTTFATDAPLSMPDYPISETEEETTEEPETEEETTEEPETENPENNTLLTVDKTVYKVGESIMVSAVGSGTDWVGIAPVGSESSERWWYVTSVGSGTTFDLTATLSGDEKTGEFAAGEYLIALIPNDKPWSSGDYLATVSITIEE